MAEMKTVVKEEDEAEYREEPNFFSAIGTSHNQNFEARIKTSKRLKVYSAETAQV